LHPSLDGLGDHRDAVASALAAARRDRVVRRIWEGDHTLWKPDPDGVADRLGWLRAPQNMAPRLPEIASLVEGVRAEGFTHALLLGMGGSSLAPEVLRKVFGVREGHVDLAVLDTTDPGEVLEGAETLDPRRTLFIVSTKSGGTVETVSLMKYFFNRAGDVLGSEEAGRRFVAITDPGSRLEDLAKDLGFRKIFLNDPDIGGRYSALSFFGLVPAACIGVDMARLLESASRMAQRTRADDETDLGLDHPAALGVALGTLARAGRDKLTLVPSERLAPFGDWVEQLIAESTGKAGRGILPVHGETLGGPGVYGADRYFVRLTLGDDRAHEGALENLRKAGHPILTLALSDPHELGGEFYRWEVATAVAGSLLSVNPFDQPDVESAKVSARNMADRYRREGALPAPTPALEDRGIAVYGETRAATAEEALRAFVDAEGSYVALLAFLRPTAETREALEALRRSVRDRTRRAATTGFGPRFLHSTGQLHKGDGGRGLFVQFTEDPPRDAPIPDRPGESGSSLSFGVLKSAQALGDRQALLDAGRRLLLFHVGSDAPGALRRLAEGVAIPGPTR
jgi:glucose-6-phosphate isomerase